MKNGHELLQMVDTLSREKGIGKKEVITAIEEAIQKAARGKYGQEYDIRATIDLRLGDIELFRYREIVEDVENTHTELSVEEARRFQESPQVGDSISEKLPPFDFGRVAAQTARQVIFQGLKSAEREKQYLEFKDREGELVSGIVRRIEFGNVIVDIGRTEALLYRNELINREAMRPGDRVRAIILEVRRESRGSQIFLSRTHPDFMVKLFEQEVPEIHDGHIQIKGAARDPGSRAKLAVYTTDSTIDPVGACVGMRGSRVQAVVAELQGEKVDIVPWSADLATFVVNALVPAEVSKIIVDEERGRIEVVVQEEQLSLAIGRRGQNVRLASKLAGIPVDIISAEADAERREKSLSARSALFIEALDVDEAIADLLAEEGFETLEDVVYVDTHELSMIDGFDEDIAAELKNRAQSFLSHEETRLSEICAARNVEKELMELEGLPLKTLAAFAEKGITTRDDLGDLSGDEVVDLLKEEGIDIKLSDANALIMRARAHWFENEA